MNQSDTLSLLDQLRRRWISEGRNISHPATTDEVDSFCARHSVTFPASLRNYCMTLNGLAENDLDGLARLWPLQEFQRITERLPLYERYAPTTREAWDRGVPIHAPLKGRENYLRFPPESDADDTIVTPPRWALPNADGYFIFGDYNIEGSYWAIRLCDDGDNAVITVYDYSNVYVPSAASFDEFIGVYVNDCPDVIG